MKKKIEYVVGTFDVDDDNGQIVDIVWYKGSNERFAQEAYINSDSVHADYCSVYVNGVFDVEETLLIEHKLDALIEECVQWKLTYRNGNEAFKRYYKKINEFMEGEE